MPDRGRALSRLLDILPEGVAPVLMTGMTSGSLDAANLQVLLSGFDWDAHRNVVEDLLRALLPVEELVPEVYAKWRPVVRDGIAFVGARLSPDRLVPKLIEQLALRETAPLEDRVMLFISRIPTLQKIGQIVSRNPDLDAKFRSRLELLEEGIREVTEPEIRAEIERGLASQLADQLLELEPGLYAEGSVSALMRFKRRFPGSSEPLTGVLKVLKPFITRHFQEDLALLEELANFFEANRNNYDLDQLNLRAILDNVRELFERETDFVNERANLMGARFRYTGVPGIRVPQPLSELSTETITAMTEEPSVKIVEAFADDPQRRAGLARNLAECLVARPLFSWEASSPFHADPHAGNLRVDEATGDIVLLDWALTGSLTEDDRRNLILLFVMLPLRDEGHVQKALLGLSLSKTDATRDLLKQEIERFMDSLPLGSIPGSGSLTSLVGRLLSAGAQFSGQFLIFRKMLFTLQDLITQLSPGVTIERVVSEYALTHRLRNVRCKGVAADSFRIPLRGRDFFSIGLSVQTLLPRGWLQTVRSIARSLGAIQPPAAKSALEPAHKASEED